MDHPVYGIYSEYTEGMVMQRLKEIIAKAWNLSLEMENGLD